MRLLACCLSIALSVHVSAGPVVSPAYGITKSDVKVKVGRYRSTVVANYSFIRTGKKPKDDEPEYLYKLPIFFVPVLAPKDFKMSETLVNGLRFRAETRWKPKVSVASAREVRAIEKELPEVKGARIIWFSLDFPPIAPDKIFLKISYQQPSFFLNKESHFSYIPFVVSHQNFNSKNMSIRYTPEEGHRMLLMSENVKPNFVQGDYLFTPWHKEPITVKLIRKDQK